MNKKKKLQALQEEVSNVSQAALEIRELEFRLQREVTLENKDSKQIQDLVERIAKLRTQLTMVHIDCIHGSKQILTPKQDRFFIQKSGIKK